jgi:hypothetical protein
MKRIALLLALLPCLTFGQSMAAHHGAAAAANWREWWKPTGLIESQCVAAYAAKGSASQAASYLNLVSASTHAITASVAPTWDTAVGWTFNGASQFLATDIVPTATYSVIVKFNGGGALSIGAVVGAYNNAVSTTRFYIRPSYSTSQHTWAYGNYGTLVGGPITSGVLALCAGLGYIDGVADGTQNGFFTGASVTFYIGALHIGAGISNYWGGNVTSIAFYNVILTPAQVVEIGARMP